LLPWPDWTDEKAKAGEAVFFRNLIERFAQIPDCAQSGRDQWAPMTGGLAHGLFALMRQDEAPKKTTTLDELSHQFDVLF
jgi:hypothetical protein